MEVIASAYDYFQVLQIIALLCHSSRSNQKIKEIAIATFSFSGSVFALSNFSRDNFKTGKVSENSDNF